MQRNIIFYFSQGGCVTTRVTYYPDKEIANEEVERAIAKARQSIHLSSHQELLYVQQIMDRVVKLIGGSWMYMNYDVTVRV